VTGDSSFIPTVRLPAAVTIRTLDDYVTQGCMSFGVAQLLAACVAHTWIWMRSEPYLVSHPANEGIAERA
jgi:hypothetical protein